MLLPQNVPKKKARPGSRGTFQAVSPTWVRGMTGAKGAACSERDGVIVPRKRQLPDAGIALVTRGGPSFLAHSVVVAYIAEVVKKN